MLVKDLMKTEVVTLTPDAAMSEALQLLRQHSIRHIPIVNEHNHVVGIVSDRDIRDASPSILDDSIDKQVLSRAIQEIMSKPVITTHPYQFFEEVATIFYQKEIACLPVVQNNQLVGVITEKDLLHAFIQLTGTYSPSTQLEIKVPDRIGILADVCQYFTRRNIRIVSVYSYPSSDNPDDKVLVFRIQTMNPLPVVKDLHQSEYEVLFPYKVNKDEI